jgi:hypothetical protein
MNPLSSEPIAVVFSGSGFGLEEDDGGEGVTLDGGEEALTSPSSSSSPSSFSLSFSGVGVAPPPPLFALGFFFFGVELGELPVLPALLALLFKPLSVVRLLPRHTPIETRAITAIKMAANTLTFSSIT